MGIKMKYSYLLLTAAIGLASCGGENGSADTQSSQVNTDTVNTDTVNTNTANTETSLPSKNDNASNTDVTEPVIPIAKGKMVINNFRVNGRSRSYTIYIPQSYTGKATVPLLMSFHGLTSDMEKNYSGTKLYELAEKENFILVHPNGINRMWNVLALSNNRDIDFTEKLINSLSAEYKIDSNRVYATGMSNGGYLSISLACALSDKVAAVASVTGTMFPTIFDKCKPTRPVSLMQIHGTADPVVGYDTVDGVLDFWIKRNGTDTVPVVTNLPDIDKTDGSTVEKHIYKNGLNGSEVQHLKIYGGGHSWAGISNADGVNRDISASAEVWNFLKRFRLNDK